MSYNIDNSLIWNNLFIFTTDAGTKYIAKFEEVSEGIWTLDFQLSSGEPLRSEIFKTMKFLGDNTSDFLDERERNLIDKGLYPDNPPSNFNPFIENMAKITKDPLEQNSKFLEKYFKSMN